MNLDDLQKLHAGTILLLRVHDEDSITDITGRLYSIKPLPFKTLSPDDFSDIEKEAIEFYSNPLNYSLFINDISEESKWHDVPLRTISYIENIPDE